ncbi:MAG: hypothetical protein ILO34_05635, partial [Kiritimatiellae bacterium]|nr:hypothetical protein [Kiritimatiellia bacterium]
IYRGFYPSIPWFLHASPPAFAKGGYRHELSAAKSVPDSAAMAQKKRNIALLRPFPHKTETTPENPCNKTAKALI